MKRAGVAVVLALAACSHEQPFLPGQYGPDGPYSPGASWQLTFSPADDRMPAWVPGETSFWYEFTRTDRLDRDHCLGLLPYPGGSRMNQLCYTSPTADDSTDVFESPSVAADGRVAFLHVQGRRGGNPNRGELLVAHGGTVQRVVRVPPPTAGGPSYDRAGYIQWIGADTLAWVAQVWAPLRIFPSPVPDTFLIGLGVDVLRLGDSIPVRVPGTDSATSLAAGDTAGVLYFTRFGDSRVYRLELATSDTSTLFDFGALGIARDVQVHAGRLLAVVGGNISATYDPIALLALQDDDGGPLYYVDLAVGTPVQAGDPSSFYQRPILSRDGRTVVVERRSPGQPDLWVVLLP